VERWLARFGREETVDLLEWNNRRPAYGVRVNTARHGVETVRDWLREREVVHAPSPFLDDFLRLVRLQALVQSDLLDDGACAVQDEGAGLVVRLLDPQPGETVIDGCAAPGGKALYAATRMKAAAAAQDGEGGADTGRILAYDVHTSRLRLLSKAAPAHGFAGLIETEAADLKDVAARDDAPQADRVLLDAPCSGLGVLAKRADLRWQRTPDEIDDLAALQDELLDAAAALVKPGGLLVYATCTIVPEENEERVLAFCARHPDFSVEPATGFVPDECVTDEGFYATLPHRHGIDGAFGVRLRRAA
jgi:16S rRNA (cytosine967-C5)-methyltransferase